MYKLATTAETGEPRGGGGGGGGDKLLYAPTIIHYHNLYEGKLSYTL